MKRFKSIIIIFIVVIMIGIFFQLTRTEKIFNLKNENDKFFNFENDKAQNSELDENDVKKMAENYLILYDSSDDSSNTSLENVIQIFDYIRKPYEIKDVNNNGEINYYGYNSIITVMSKLEKIKNIDEIFTFVDKGGTFIVTEKPLSYGGFLIQYYRKLGIIEKYNDSYVSGINLKTNLLIKSDNLKYKNIEYVSEIVHIDSSCIVYAESDDKIPLIWEKTHGKGKIIYSNCNIINSKRNRGLLIGMLAKGIKNFIYPTVGIKTVMIDEFPLPIKQKKDSVIFKHYGKDTPAFFRDIWWPDMIKIASKNDLKYTGYLIQTYANWNDGYASISELLSRNDLVLYGRELIKLGGELGLHGYNNEPLFVEDKSGTKTINKGWESTKTMEDSLNVVNKFFQGVYDKYSIKSYSPPSNYLSEEGKKTLLKYIPEIKIISSVYNSELSSNEYEQEFKVEENGIIDFPKISSGYNEFDEKTKWEIYNCLTLLGIYSHYIHPNDLLDIKQSHGKNWDQMAKEFDSNNKEIETNFNWLSSGTISYAAIELKRYFETRSYFNYKDDNTIIGNLYNFKEETDFILSTDKKIKSCEGCTYNSIDKGFYFIKAKKPDFKINLGE